MGMKNWFFHLWIAGCVVLFTGCSSVQPKTAVQDRNPIRFYHPTAHVLASPALLKKEYCRPAGAAEQMFRWSRQGTDWILRESTTPMDSVGFHMRRPVRLGSNIHARSLRFSLRPAKAAFCLAIELISGNGGILQLPETTLAEYRSGEWLDGWHSYDIQLHQFDNGDEDISFDWNDIRQVRLVRMRPQTHLPQVEIRNLRIQAPETAMITRP